MNRRLGGLCGLGFVVLYFAYMVMLEPPDISMPSSEVVDYWADSGNRAEEIVTATMCGTAVLLFVGFVVGLALALSLSNNEPVPMDEELGLAFRTASFVAHPGHALVHRDGRSRAGCGDDRRAKGARLASLDGLRGVAPGGRAARTLVFFVLVILLLWTAVVSVWMLIFPRTAAQVTRA